MASFEQGKILIDTGPSPRGFHRIEAYLRCPQLFAWGYGSGGDGPEAKARHDRLFPPDGKLVRGAIGHVGLAHVYAGAQAIQEGEDPRAYHDPLTAMQLVAEQFGELGEEQLPVASRAVQGYVAHYQGEGIKILGVEQLEKTEFHGWPYTARVDLEYEDRTGKVWYVDHKFVAKIDKRTQSRYSLSGQVLGLGWIGARKWKERFAGVLLNFVGCVRPGFLRAIPDPAPFMFQRYPEVVAEAGEGIRYLEGARESGQKMPVLASTSEFTCQTPYGPCPALRFCQWGPPAGEEP
ncbi:MAG TPA: hypothetical protein VLY82_02715 [Nitrososphaerales archaeon]|nr:hypothetical protein [Nitrososphaerales archaeon]